MHGLSFGVLCDWALVVARYELCYVGCNLVFRVLLLR